MVSCCAFGCKSRSQKKEPGVSFHSFPKDLKRRKVWIENVSMKNWVPTANDRICSKHFETKWFYKTDTGTKACLLNQAVPTIFPQPSEVFTQIKTDKVHRPRLKWPVLSLSQLKENGSKITSWCEDRKVAGCYLKNDGEESCSDDEFIETAPKRIKTKNKKEKNTDKEFDYASKESSAIKKEIDDVNDLTDEELLNYSRKTPKSGFIQQKALHIKDEDDSEDMPKNEK